MGFLEGFRNTVALPGTFLFSNQKIKPMTLLFEVKGYYGMDSLLDLWVMTSYFHLKRST